MSAVAVGALLTTYTGGLRNFSYVRAQPLSAFAACSPGATEVANDAQLQAAVVNSVDDSIICITADITVSQTLILDDTTVTFEGREIGGQDPVLSGDDARRIIDADFTDNSSDDTLTVRNLVLAQGRTSGEGGALQVAGGNRSDAVVISGAEIAGNYSTRDGGGVSARNLASVYITNANFHDDTVGDAAAGDISGGALKVANTAHTTIIDSYFRDNSSVEWGGAIFLNDSGVTRISGSTFERNSSGAQAGGAVEIDIDDSTLPGAVYITSSVFRQNSSASNVGGAIRITDNDDTVSFDQVGFYGNSAGSAGVGRNGGAIHMSFQSGPVFLNSVRAFDNRSTVHGGFMRMSSSTARVHIAGLDSRRNIAQSDGGSVNLASGSLDLSNSVFTDDSAGLDGGALATTNLTALNVTGVSVSSATANRDGGALYAGANDVVTVSNSTFTSNIAGDDGGALEIVDSPLVYLTDIVVRLNEARGDDGGGILINDADDTVSLSSVTLDRNSAAAEGGGIKIVDSDGVVVLDDISATGNSAGTAGGAIYVNDPVSTTITNSTFTSNTAGNDGGAIRVLRSQSVYLTNSVVRLNRALLDQGGGILIEGGDDTVALGDVLLEGNQAADRGGGLNILNHSGVVLADRISVLGNSSTNSSGGGMYLDVDGVNGEVHIRNSTIANNDAVNVGGGVFLQMDVNAPASILNSTITGNSTTDFGGGGLWINRGITQIEFTTITGNSSASGGGLETDSPSIVNASNSIIAGNTAPTAADVLINTGSTFDDSFSLFSSAAAVSGATIDGPGSIFGAPRLNGLADNGGPTLTMLPQWDSPGFEAGDPNWTAPPANDQRGAGFPRDAGGRVSMGAIQGRSAQPPAPVFPPSSPREVTAVAGDAQAVVSWRAPATSGSFPVTTYQVDDSTGAFSCLVTVTPGEPLECVIEGLVNGQEYTFRARALNGAGWGAWSALTDPVTPRPGASILITGSRDGRFVRVAGSAPGLEGDALVPRVRFPGPKPATTGTSRPVVDEQGEFSWQRRANKKTYVYFVTEDGELRSNRVTIRSRR